MRLPAFDVVPARTVAEAAGLLRELGEASVVLAGGTELLLLLKLGFAEYTHLIDIKHIPELQALRVTDGFLEIGGAITHRQLERSPLVRAGWPALASMEHGVANVRVRGVGTLAGNLCFADPHSDPATFLMAAGAIVVCGGASPVRRVPLDEFLIGPYQTALDRHELLTAILVPVLRSGAAMVHTKLSFRERPAVTVACQVQVDGGRMVGVRVAVGSVGVVPVRARTAETLLVGGSADRLDAVALDAAAVAAADESGPVADANGSVEYKRHLVGVLMKRCLREAAAAASGRAAPSA